MSVAMCACIHSPGGNPSQYTITPSNYNYTILHCLLTLCYSVISELVCGFSIENIEHQVYINLYNFYIIIKQCVTVAISAHWTYQWGF